MNTLEDAFVNIGLEEEKFFFKKRGLSLSKENGEHTGIDVKKQLKEPVSLSIRTYKYIWNI